MRIGHGYDAHRLEDDRELILGGVTIPFEKGLVGHSDADVLAHALCDALLGAAALGDLGKHFPDCDDQYKNADSMKLLNSVGKMINRKGFTIGNIDATVIAQQPRLMPYIPAMIENIGRALEISVGQISVKATTTEGMGFTGAGQGISAWASVLIQ
jgi:2-C-methyl-D-erythritol 2,4-cyclodiphosphate synthase